VLASRWLCLAWQLSSEKGKPAMAHKARTCDGTQTWEAANTQASKQERDNQPRLGPAREWTRGHKRVAQEAAERGENRPPAYIGTAQQKSRHPVTNHPLVPSDSHRWLVG